MKIWESLFIHILQIQNLLIEEQKVNDPNPPYELAQDVALHNLSLHAFCVPSRFFYWASWPIFMIYENHIVEGHPYTAL